MIYPDQANHGAGLDASAKHFVPVPIQAYYFDKTKELLAAAGITVPFVPVPDSDTTVKAMAPEAAADFDHFLAMRTAGLTNVVMISRAIIAWPDNLFADGST